jgi:hypothetical protein
MRGNEKNDWFTACENLWYHILKFGPKNANYEGFKKIMTTLRKNVFSYVDIEAT